MAHGFEGARGASAFGVSNVNPLLVACVYASLKLFRDAGGIPRLRRKSLLLTTYLEKLLEMRGLLPPAGAPPSTHGKRRATLRLLTPAGAAQRGCQLSLRVVPAAGVAVSPKGREPLITTHHHSSPLITPHHSPLIAHYSPLTAHHSPLTTHHSPLITHHSSLITLSLIHISEPTRPY